METSNTPASKPAPDTISLMELCGICAALQVAVVSIAKALPNAEVHLTAIRIGIDNVHASCITQHPDFHHGLRETSRLF